MSAKFWASPGAEAKRKYRYILDVGKADLESYESWVIQKVNRPSFSISEATHAYLNHQFYFPGRLTWENVSFSVVDAVNRDSTAILMSWLSASGYRLPRNADQADAKGTISKGSSVMKCIINAIDADGNHVDQWELHNAWILSANLGEYDYTSDDLMSIDITLKYDYATYAINNDANAAPSTRTAFEKLQIGKSSG